MNRLPLRLPLGGPTLEHLRHRERIDWHDHAEQQLVYPSSGLLIVSTQADPGSFLRSAPCGCLPRWRTRTRPTVPRSCAPSPSARMSTARPDPAHRAERSRLLRELIIAAHRRSGSSRLDEQHDLKRVALHELRPATGAAVPPAAAATSASAT